MALLSAEEARAYLASPPTGSSIDPTLTRLVAAVSSAAAVYCGFPRNVDGDVPTMESATYAIELDGRGGREIRLPVFPVSEVTSIRVDYDRDFDDADDDLSASDYALVDKAAGLVRLKSTSTQGTWPNAPGVIRATFVAGVDSPEVPSGLKDLIGRLVRHFYDLGTNQGKPQSSQAGVSVTFEPTVVLPKWAEVELSRWRLPGSVIG